MARRTLIVAVIALALASGAQAVASKTALKVTYWPHGRSQPATIWTLRCAPAAGTHPAAIRTCAQLRGHPAALRPAARACTLMPTRTSPQAAIQGTWAGRPVNRSYRIGCPGWSDLRLVLTGHS
jgi:hypothetical protein